MATHKLSGNKLKQAIQKIILSLLTLVILYSNMAIIFGHFSFIRRPPVDPLSFYLFNIYSVFSSARFKTNLDYVLWVYTSDVWIGEKQWERLETNEYFPFKRGEQHSRMLIRLHKFNLSHREYTAAQALMMAKIRKKYNREHFSKRALKAALTVERWPKSRREYEEFRTPELTRSRYMYVEE